MKCRKENFFWRGRDVDLPKTEGYKRDRRRSENSATK